MTAHYRGATLAALLLTLVVTPRALAGPIVSGVEWLQPALLLNHSWNEFQAACGGGTCSGQLGANGPDISGWEWASAQELGDLLLAPSSDHPGGIAQWTEPTAAALNLINLGLGPTTTVEQNLQDGIYAAFGFTATTAPNGNPYWGGFGFDLGFFAPGGSFFLSNQADIAPDAQDPTLGAWLYRSATVPLPGSVPLLGVALLALILGLHTRFRGHSPTSKGA